MAGSPRDLRRLAPARRTPFRPAVPYGPPSPGEARIERELLTGLVSEETLFRALHSAQVQGVSPVDALVACTGADVDDITARLAHRLGINVLTEIDFAPDALAANAGIAALQAGILRLPDGTFVAALRGRAIVLLHRFLRTAPHASHRIRLATPNMFTAAVLHAAGKAIADNAASGLENYDPAFSARSRTIVRACFAGAGLIGLGAIVAAAISPLTASFAFGMIFMTLTALRLLAVLGDPAARPFAREPDELLPVYTVLVPLYREASCIRGLIRALDALDYPQAKLDIKILVETNDSETRAALQARHMPNHFEVLVVPDGAPRTKPRALNAGLAAARGSLLAVYDAEDRPDPSQLRIAANAFIRGGPRLACAQARLAIDNIKDGWLTRVFALEYAGLFDALLPGLARSRIFFPLGGTSNHFRTAVLDRIGGWDAWNVTEDADLGVRIARLGYQSRIIQSTTLEEAPNTTKAWLKQRTRWLKGYMVTWSVHMRNPVRLYRDLGLVNFLAFHAFIGGVPISAIILPVFIGGVAGQIVMGVWLSPGASIARALPYLMDGFNLILGFGTAMALAAIGADRRGLKRFAIWIPTVPFYWLLSSVAAWRAIWQLARTPYLWEKTEHGLARTSQSRPLTDCA